jgi:GxxExxY protein
MTPGCYARRELLFTAEAAEAAEDTMNSTPVNEITGQIIDAAMRVHSALGPGLLESAYQACLAYEIRRRKLSVSTQIELPVVYERVRLDVGYRIDLLVEQIVVVELKAVRKLKPIHDAQLLSYLKLSGHPVGLLINFHELHLRDGVRRMVNNL